MLYFGKVRFLEIVVWMRSICNYPTYYNDKYLSYATSC